LLPRDLRVGHLQMADAHARGEKVLFSFEEAIGFCCGSVVRDKDGVCAAAVFAEMAQALGRRGVLVAEHLDSLYARYGHFVTANFYVFVDAPDKMAVIFERLRNEGHYWGRLG
jgi:phosphomannomutase